MRCGAYMTALVGLLTGSSAWAEDMTVGFDAAVYSTKIGETVPLRVEFSSTSPVTLFSYGFRLVYDSSSGATLSRADVSIPAALDFNGTEGANAVVDITPGMVGLKGTVNVFGDPIQYYGDPLLATFQFRPFSVGEYDLRLELYRTLGDAEDVFVSGSGTKLDAQIAFGHAKVSVIPEPGSLSLLLAFSGLAAGAWLTRRRQVAPKWTDEN